MKDLLTKEKVVKSLDKLPQKFSAEDLFERILLLQKIEEGLDDIETGRTISDEDLKNRLKEWLD